MKSLHECAPSYFPFSACPRNGGAVLYLDFSGNLTSGIVIRTVLIKDKTAYLQAGAGIVADSVPAREYEERQNKARAVLRAFELAEKGL